MHDNLSDLRAQVAANQKGIQLVGELIGQYGLDVVQAYMGHIQVRQTLGVGAGPWAWVRAPAAAQASFPQANAELAVRDMLRAFGSARQAQGLPLEVSAEDHMDDGSPIRLRVQVNLSQVGREGTGGRGGKGWPPADWVPCLVPRRGAPCSTSAAPGPRCSAT